MTLAEIIARRGALRAEGDGILAAARAANIDLTEAQDARLAAISTEMDGLWSQRDAAETAERDAAVTTARAAAHAEGLSAGRAAALEIVALCQIAGKPAAAHAFLKDGKSVDDVRAALAGEAAADRREDTNPRRGIADASKASSWDDSIARANRLNGIKPAA